MSTLNTPYLGLPYNELSDKGFRELYGQSMQIIDSLFPTVESTIYPENRNPVYSDGFFTPSSGFKSRDGLTRYMQLGTMVFFEIGVESTKSITTSATGDIVNLTVGTISQKFSRRRGYFVTSINGVAAHYDYSGTKGATIQMTAVGGNLIGETIPKGSYFGIAGHFHITD